MKATLARWFAQTISAILGIPPVYLFLLFAMLIAVTSLWCFLAFDTWPDRYTAASYYVSLFGFGYVLVELFRGKRLADVARENYERAARAMRTQHYEFCLDEANRELDLALRDLSAKQWTHAAKSLQALARRLFYIHGLGRHADERWRELSQLAGYWAADFATGSNGKNHEYDRQAWLQAHTSCSETLAGEQITLNPLRGDYDDTPE